MEKIKNNIKNLKQLIEDIQKVDVFKNGNEANYNKIFNLVNNYVNYTSDYDLQDVINHYFVTYDLVQENCIYSINDNGLKNTIKWLNGVNLDNNVFRIKNDKCYDLTISDIEFLKVELLKEINERLEENKKELEKRRTLLLTDEIMQGDPLRIEQEIKIELSNQIRNLTGNNYEDVVTNMRQLADVIEILEEHINDEFITLRYNPMGAWYISEEDEDGGNDEE